MAPMIDVVKRATAPLRHNKRLDAGLEAVAVYRKLRTGNPVVVYQTMKTASTSITHTLRAATGRPLFACHRITRSGVAQNAEILAQRGVDRHVWLRSDWRGDAVRRWIGSHPQRRVDLITTVREPVAQAVSSFFQMGYDYGYIEEGREADTDLDALVETMLSSWANPLIAGDWFVEELGLLTGLDVYAEPFDPAKGYRVYEHGQFRVLLLRFEDLAAVGGAALGEFMGLPPLELLSDNVTDRKSSGDLYRRFKAGAELPRRWMETLYSLPVATHFYTDNERAAFYERWSRNSRQSARNS